MNNPLSDTLIRISEGARQSLVDQHLTIQLFIIAQVVTIGLAILGWVFATKRTLRQLNRQHLNAIKEDEARLRSDLTVKVVMELIGRLAHLRRKAAQVAGAINAATIALPQAAIDSVRKEVFVKTILQDFQRSWEEVLQAGFDFTWAFDSHQPVVDRLTPKREELFQIIQQVLECRTTHARRFHDRALTWFTGLPGSPDSDSVSEALSTCKNEFDALHLELDRSVIDVVSMMQNDFIKPFFLCSRGPETSD